MNYPQLSDLVTQMKNSPSTNGWDVVCSYNVVQLNAFLKSQYEAGSLVNHFKQSIDRQDPLYGVDITISYDIQIGTPILAFTSGVTGQATLTMPILDGSSYSVGPKGSPPVRTTTIPGGKYSIQANVPLAAINGTTGEVVEAGNIVTFSDGNVHDNHVIIHFNNEKGANFLIQPVPEPSDKDPMETYFLPAISQYFQDNVNAIDYALAAVNNSKPTDGASVLTPQSFIFHTAADDNSDGVLSLYIQTVESGNDPGDRSPNFQPGGSTVYPIPEGYTASVVLSQPLLRKVFLQPQLTNNGFSVTFLPVSDGISMQLRKNASVLSDGDSGTYIFGGHSYDGLSISLNDWPLTLAIQDNKLSLQWQGSADSSWSEYSMGSNGGTWGKVTLTITLHKDPAALTLSTDDEIGGQLSVSRSDFSIEVKSHGCSFWETVNHCSESAPPYYSDNMTLTIPSIQIAFSGLNFFSTTNLVSPGQTVINFDTKAGVQTPFDFLLVGNVVSKA
ncbi:hypothetical protein H8B09_11750 [Paenibacillus sp. PR3]|uniref:Uncharacterized protein n=1 Tax=Paenibacillus terricola TaxID=2763503 RepID=A0ABR8MU63_9BACL|nr:hypothetical protein [Paenibacillus terricola]MBD3919428.1 hypothetical protein [Paenibacillus terricola]